MAKHKFLTLYSRLIDSAENMNEINVINRLLIRSLTDKNAYLNVNGLVVRILEQLEI